MTVAGRRLYPIQVAEKGFAAYRIAVRGTWGHGSMPREDNAAVLAAAVIERLAVPGPTRITPVMARFLDLAGGRHCRPTPRPVLRGLAGDDPVARRGRPCRRLRPDVRPGPARPRCATRSARTSSTPGSSTTSSRATRRSRSTAASCPGTTEPDDARRARRAARAGARGRLPDRADRLRRPGRGAGRGRAVRPPRRRPSATTTRTGSRSRSWPRSPRTPSTPPRVGTPTYGFSPLRLDPDERFLERFHGVDERVSVDALRWGLPVLYDVVRRFCG